MKRGRSIILLLICISSVFCTTLLVSASQHAVPGELVVTYRTDMIMGQSVGEVHANQHAETKMLAKSANKQMDLVKVAPDKLEEAIESYNNTPGVEIVEPNFLIETQAHPSDPSYNTQYALHSVNARRAWDYEVGNSSVIIAIIDTGVDWNHPDLAQNIWNNTDEVVDGTDSDGNGFIDDIRGYDFVNSASSCDASDDCDTEDNDPGDYQGHGTHVSGIAAGRGNNSIGMTGMCWQCTIMPIRSGYKHTSGVGTLSVADVVQGINYAVDNGAHILSMSFAGGQSATITAALEAAHDAGLVLVAAAGNSGVSTKTYPAAQPEVIGVASTDSSDARSSFSNYGSWVEVAAPGSSIYSTYFDDTYATLSGTSMSTPLVSGLAGIILSKNPDLTNEQVRSIIKSTAANVSDAKFIGTGIINALDAVLRADSPIVGFNDSTRGASITGHSDIIGISNGSSLVNYTVSYGEGIYPSVYTPIFSSSSPVHSGRLATWDTSLLTNGTYTLQLSTSTTESHTQGLSATLEVEGDESLSVANSSLQSFTATSADVYAVRLTGGVDNDVFWTQILDTNNSIIATSDKVTVFETDEIVDLHIGATLISGYNYSLRILTEDGDNISLKVNTSGPYANGNLSSGSSVDLAFSLLNQTSVTNLESLDMTTVTVSNSQFSFILLSTESNQTSATINWSTSQSTNGTLFYGSDLSLSSSIDLEDYGFNHSVILENLSANLTYFFNVSMCNVDTTCQVNGTYSFNTTVDIQAPNISNVIVTGRTNQSLTVEWVTDELATSQIVFNTNETLVFNVSNASLTQSHSLTILSLIPNTTYFFQAVSCDNSDNCASGMLSNASTWVTDIPPVTTITTPSNNSIVYASPAILGCQATDDLLVTRLSVWLNTSGSFTEYANISTSASTVYHNFSVSVADNVHIAWRCRSTDNASQSHFSDPQVIITSLPPTIITQDPINSKQFSAGTTSTTIRLTTSEIAECRISNNNVSFGNMTVFNETDALTHNSSVVGLSNGQSYSRYVSCQDAAGNTMPSSLISFSVKSPSSGGGGGGGGGGSSGSYYTTTSPPVHQLLPPVYPTATTEKQVKKQASLSDTQTIKNIQVMAGESVPVSIAIAVVSESKVPTPLPDTFEYLSVKPSVSGITEASIQFAVPKSKVYKNSVTLHHFTSEWVELPTTFIDETGTDYLYEAQTDGFSFYAITAAKKEVQFNDSVQINDTTVEEEPAGSSQFIAWTFGIIGLILIASGVVVYRRRR